MIKRFNFCLFSKKIQISYCTGAFSISAKIFVVICVIIVDNWFCDKSCTLPSSLMSANTWVRAFGIILAKFLRKALLNESALVEDDGTDATTSLTIEFIGGPSFATGSPASLRILPAALIVTPAILVTAPRTPETVSSAAWTTFPTKPPTGLRTPPSILPKSPADA